MFSRIRGLNRRHACPKKKRKTRSDRSSPCPATVSIRLDSEDGVYVPEDEVTGKLILEANTNLKVACLKAGLRGVAKVQWSDVDRFIAYTTHHRASKDYVCDYKLILGTDGCTDDRKCYHLVRGRHEYRFKFSLPLTGLTTSYEGKHGAVRYWIQAELEAPKYNPYKTKKIFTLINPIDINEQQYQYPVERQAQKNVGCCPVRRGHVILSARADRNGYCPGESVAITGEFENYTSHAIVPSATLMQKQTYKADGRTKVRTVRLTSITYATIGAGRMTSWDAQPLRVPPIPPSITTCPLIRLEYYVTMTLQISRRCTLKVDIPLVVGTVPYRLLRVTGLPAAPPYSPPANMGCPPPAYSECMSDSEDPEFEPHYTYVRDYAFQSPPRYSEIDPYPERRLSRKKFESDSESSVDSDNNSDVRSSNVSSDSVSLQSDTEKPCSCNTYYNKLTRRSSPVFKNPCNLSCSIDSCSFKSKTYSHKCTCDGEMSWRCCEHGQITEMRSSEVCECKELDAQDDDRVCNCSTYRGRVSPLSICTCAPPTNLPETVQFRAEVRCCPLSSAADASAHVTSAADASAHVTSADDDANHNDSIQPPPLKCSSLQDVCTSSYPKETKKYLRLEGRTLSEDICFSHSLTEDALLQIKAEENQTASKAPTKNIEVHTFNVVSPTDKGEENPDFIVYQVLEDSEANIPNRNFEYSTCVQMHPSVHETAAIFLSDEPMSTENEHALKESISHEIYSKKLESSEDVRVLDGGLLEEMESKVYSQRPIEKKGNGKNRRVFDEQRKITIEKDSVTKESNEEGMNGSNDDEMG